MLTGQLMRGERLRLAAHTKEDLPVILHWYEDSEFVRLVDTTPAFPRMQAWAEQRLDEIYRMQDGYQFGIRLLEGDTLIGLIAIEGIDWQHGVGWLAVGIGEKQYRGKGYGTEALRLLLRFAFHEINLHRVQLTVFSYNTPAIASYEKLGFVREGVFRERLQRDGQRHDMLLFGLLRPEWEAQQR